MKCSFRPQPQGTKAAAGCTRTPVLSNIPCIALDTSAAYAAYASAMDKLRAMATVETETVIPTEAEVVLPTQAEAVVPAQTEAEPVITPLPLPEIAGPSGPETPGPEPEAKRKNLTNQERVAIVHFLLANSAGGRLKHGDIKTAATHFGVHRATIRRLWKLHAATSNAEGLAGNVASRIKGRSGRKPKLQDDELKARIAAVPVERRMTGRSLSSALGVSNSVVVRLIRDGKLKRHPKKLHYVM
ncbi:hypothetical protein BBJ28_00012196 [Nothophytophthora sp. Chile5]|nr:hypothetical protein BBJ28_00012196 [Nothophytophthora sp. Chile5]